MLYYMIHNKSKMNMMNKKNWDKKLLLIFNILKNNKNHIYSQKLMNKTQILNKRNNLRNNYNQLTRK
jgi:hypothetical protein